MRQCKATNKQGKPCGAKPMHDSDWCNAHHPDLPESSRFRGGAKPGAGRPRNPRAVDVLRERIEADVEKVIEPLFDALVADRGLALTVKGGGMVIGYSADHSTRIQAARELLDRAYGRPKQQTEVTGPDGGPLRFEPPPDADLRSTRAGALLGEVAARELAATNGHSNGSNGHR